MTIVVNDTDVEPLRDNDDREYTKRGHSPRRSGGRPYRGAELTSVCTFGLPWRAQHTRYLPLGDHLAVDR